MVLVTVPPRGNHFIIQQVVWCIILGGNTLDKSLDFSNLHHFMCILYLLISFVSMKGWSGSWRNPERDDGSQTFLQCNQMKAVIWKSSTPNFEHEGIHAFTNNSEFPHIIDKGKWGVCFLYLPGDGECISSEICTVEENDTMLILAW